MMTWYYSWLRIEGVVERVTVHPTPLRLRLRVISISGKVDSIARIQLVIHLPRASAISINLVTLFQFRPV